MHFNTLGERMEYYKSLTDYRLPPNSYVICHVDGKNFSKKIKKFFKLPFDSLFIDMMNESAKYACKNIQGCKMAYTQSDEISFIITDFDSERTDSYYSFRLCKMQSIIASLVTSKFQQLFLSNFRDKIDDDNYLFQFDCKCFSVPTYNDAFAWLKYRQNDCIRNSKQQAARSYCSHRELINKNTDEQIEYLKEKFDIDWNDYSDGEKYGRVIFKEEEDFQSIINSKEVSYLRSVWNCYSAPIFTKEWFNDKNILKWRTGNE